MYVTIIFWRLTVVKRLRKISADKNMMRFIILKGGFVI